jgi:hypothetical protein
MIFSNIKKQLDQLIHLLNQLESDQYTKQIAHLSNASIGEHSRHIIELLKCTIDGYSTNKVDYINRSRNTDIEKDQYLAVKTIESLLVKLNLPDKILNLNISEKEGLQSQQVFTTYYRELVYNEEHIIHHLALIKVALFDMNLDLVDQSFGLAHSTMLYQKKGVK